MPPPPPPLSCVLSCFYSHSKCSWLARLCPTIFLLYGLSIHSPLPISPIPSICLKSIEFTYCHHQFLEIVITLKLEKYHSLLNTIPSCGWLVDPLLSLKEEYTCTQTVLTKQNSTSHSPTSRICKSI